MIFPKYVRNGFHKVGGEHTSRKIVKFLNAFRFGDVPHLCCDCCLGSPIIRGLLWYLLSL